MILYYMDLSPPCRAAMLTLRYLGMEFEKKQIDLFTKEQMKPQFLEINPQHCLPTLVDGDLVIWESRAICAYLASRYGNNDLLYPKDPKKRVAVDMLLYFDMGSLGVQYGDYMGPVIYEGGKEPVQSKLPRLLESLLWFNETLRGKKFATGNDVTIADHSLIATISSFQEAGIHLSDFPCILKWIENCETTEMPGYKSDNFKRAKEFGNFVKQRVSL